MSAHPSPGPSSQPGPRQHKQKPLTIGIAAGAEDAKYQAKYKDLKRKVKDIENENDKLHMKVLQAKHSIQRMKLERAILYERLTGAPTPLDTPNRHPAAQPIHSGPVPPPPPPHPPFSRPHSESHHYQDVGDNHPPIESDRSTTEYGTPRERHRVAQGSDARVVSGGVAPMPPGVGHVPHIPESRRPPAGYELSRHTLHMQSIPGPSPIHHPRPSPIMHHAHSHERTRPHSRTHSHSQPPYAPNQPHHQHPESLPPVQQVMNSPPILERERPRRHDNNESFGSHADPHQHNRLSSFMPRLSPPPPGSRSSSRVHSHQRMSPGPYITREESYDRHRGIDHEREWEHEREREWERGERERGRGRDRSDHGRHRDVGPIVSPSMTHRPRHPSDRGGDYPEHMSSSRTREDYAYYREAPLPPPPTTTNSGYPVHSRSGSPVSVSVSAASGSGGNGAGDGSSRPGSRHYYEHHDRTRSYRLRPVNQPNEDNMDFVHEDGRPMTSRDRGVSSGGGGGGTGFPPPQPEQGRSSLDTRKRGRNDMDIDSDEAGEGPMYSGGRTAEDRGKRYHREHHRSVDNQEDGRMGPP